MKWFKFYGQDFLTDTKLIGIDPLLRAIWITLLCLADENGEIKYLKERDLQRLSGCDDDQLNDPSDYDRTSGCLEFFQERGMIALHPVTNSNAGHNGYVTYHITLCNYLKRQVENLSNAERQKRYRERMKISNKNSKVKAKTQSNDNNIKENNDSNVTQRNDSNARIDKIRIDNKENIKEKVLANDSFALKYIETFNQLFRKGYTLTKERKEKIQIRLKSFTQEQIMQALGNLSKDPFNHGKNDRNWQATPDYLIRDDEKLDEWLNKSGKENKDNYELPLGFKYAKPYAKD